MKLWRDEIFVSSRESLELQQRMLSHLRGLRTPEWLMASSREGAYANPFGRDSAKTALLTLDAYSLESGRQKNLILGIMEFPQKTLSNMTATVRAGFTALAGDSRGQRAGRLNLFDEAMDISRLAITSLAKLQGSKVNIENGERPGKIIHEYRVKDYEHLTSGEKPWYVDPDEKALKNYDSLDSTPLWLLTVYKYWRLSGDNKLLEEVLPNVKAALNWITEYGDMDGDGLLEFELEAERKHGGLQVQSWADSREFFADVSGKLPKYPIAPVEVQGYAWLALREWSDFFSDRDPLLSKELSEKAERMKSVFNEKFVIEDKGLRYFAQGLDGDKNPIRTITCNPLFLLWSAYKNGNDYETIVGERTIGDLVKRVFMGDMFVKGFGVRTMSSESPTFNPKPDSYHNGSFWPMVNGVVCMGLLNFGFYKEAKKLSKSSVRVLLEEGPREIVIEGPNGAFLNYRSAGGKRGCIEQTWSAAAGVLLSACDTPPVLLGVKGLISPIKTVGVTIAELGRKATFAGASRTSTSTTQSES